MKVFELANGRQLSYSEYGNSKGKPYFYCHGFPGSRLEVGLVAAAARRNNVRVIAVDRPGFGDSTHDPHRTILSFAYDIEEMARRMGLKEFGVIGLSAGAPYALAIAKHLTFEVSDVCIIAGAVPDAHTLMRLHEWQTQILCMFAHWTVEFCPWMILHMIGLGPADKFFLQSKKVREGLYKSMREAFKHGSRGPAHDLTLLTNDWGFQPRQVGFTPVRFYHGAQDTTITWNDAMAWESGFQNSSIKVYPDSGHFSIVADHLDDIFAEIL